MNKTAISSTYALAGMLAAVAVPIGVPALRTFGAPEFAQGLLIGARLSAALLLFAFALKQRTA